MNLFNIMEVDCEDIDKAFLPSNAFSKPLLTHISGTAIPEGSPFLEKTSSMQKRLKKFPKIYR